MEEEIKKRDLTVEDVQKIVMWLSDDIYDSYVDDNNKVNALNFYVHAYDFSYVWAGIYKDYDELGEAIDNTDGSCSTYIYFFPETKKVHLAMEDVNYNWFEFEINDGEGKDLVIQLCERYCMESENKTCLELLNEMNS